MRANERAMEPVLAMDLCEGCHALIMLCSRCVSRRFCSKECAQKRRRQRVREAGRVYQATERGSALHAARQRQYRARRAASVTHQSTHSSAVSADSDGGGAEFGASGPTGPVEGSAAVASMNSSSTVPASQPSPPPPPPPTVPSPSPSPRGVWCCCGCQQVTSQWLRNREPRRPGKRRTWWVRPRRVQQPRRPRATPLRRSSKGLGP